MQLEAVGNSVPVPVVVGPVEDAVVVVVPRTLLLADKAHLVPLLNDIWLTVVVVVRVLAVGDAVVVVVDVVPLREHQALPQHALVPNCLVPPVPIGVGVQAVVVRVLAVCAGEVVGLVHSMELPIVVVEVVVEIDLEVVPNAVVVVVDVEVIVHYVPIVVEVVGVVEHAARCEGEGRHRLPAVDVRVLVVVQPIRDLVGKQVAVGV